MSSLHHEVDGRLAEPLTASLDRTGNLVTSIIPPGYERYVRILNPIETNDGSVIRWSNVVERNGLELSPWMQWDELRAHPGAVLPADGAEPAMGNPPPSLARALIRELRVDDDRYYFASWIGYAEASSQAIIEFSPSGREMALYSGSLIDEEGSAVVPVTVAGRVPMYWWPKNLRWCVGQDLYARSLIVGCDLTTAGRILAAPDLDSYLIRESDMVPSEDF
ncbi:hypothetical protein IWX75_003459 [Arthrobacter sp. CAN_A6]|uniref:hypothetical protein n=1 Tax=Arthrobacter sp. CAN_A6 TaxID=2787721 RepID=UPI0018C98BA2